MKLYLPNEEAMLAYGASLADQMVSTGGVIYLYGDLGAGKTTLVRGLLQRLGHKGAVKSPTYTLVEPYQLPNITVNHFDLYRLADPEELEYIGIRDYFPPGSLSLIEWPDKGKGEIAAPDLEIRIDYHHPGRDVELSSYSHLGRKIEQIMYSFVPKSDKIRIEN